MSTEYDPGSYNQSGMRAFMFSMVVTMVFFVYVAFVHKGVDLKEIPSDEAKQTEVAPETPEAPAEEE